MCVLFFSPSCSSLTFSQIWFCVSYFNFHIASLSPSPVSLVLVKEYCAQHRERATFIIYIYFHLLRFFLRFFPHHLLHTRMLYMCARVLFHQFVATRQISVMFQKEIELINEKVCVFLLCVYSVCFLLVQRCDCWIGDGLME